MSESEMFAVGRGKAENSEDEDLSLAQMAPERSLAGQERAANDNEEKEEEGEGETLWHPTMLPKEEMLRESDLMKAEMLETQIEEGVFDQKTEEVSVEKAFPLAAMGFAWKDTNWVKEYAQLPEKVTLSDLHALKERIDEEVNQRQAWSAGKKLLNFRETDRFLRVQSHLEVLLTGRL